MLYVINRAGGGVPGNKKNPHKYATAKQIQMIQIQVKVGFHGKESCDTLLHSVPIGQRVDV